MRHSATYSPDDNKLRLSPSHRLDADEYARVKAAGFSWAPKQGIFVAGMWTPAREDLLIELAGEIDDEDTSLVQRAEDRADRFEDYSDKRTAEAKSARDAVTAIADGIPFGQPILVGHHSEKRARKDAQRIEDGMRRTIRLFDTAGYWRGRAAGAIAAAKYKERPDVRARRIKGLEADQRKQQKDRDAAEKALAIWEKIAAMHNDPAKQLANALHFSGSTEIGSFRVIGRGDIEKSWWSAWDVLRPDGERYAACPAWTVAQVVEAAREAYPSRIAYADRWLAHIANRLEYERAMLASAGGTLADRIELEKGGACRCWASPGAGHGKGWSYIQKVNKISVTVLHTWGHGPAHNVVVEKTKLMGVMTAAGVEEARADGRLVEAGDGTGFFLRDAPPPAPRPDPVPEPLADDVAAIKAALKAGVKVAVVGQLFPTPPALAARMIREAEIEPGMSVLEPSAGTGNLLRELPAGCDPFAVEIDTRLCERLSQDFNRPEDAAQGLCRNVLQADFLDCAPQSLGAFDRIVMNPPFANGADIAHIQHARRFLKPGGRLVAICAHGPRQQAAFAGKVERWTPLPEDTFKEQGTRVRTVMLIIEGPAEQRAAPVKEKVGQISLFG